MRSTFPCGQLLLHQKTPRLALVVVVDVVYVVVALAALLFSSFRVAAWFQLCAAVSLSRAGP